MTAFCGVIASEAKQSRWFRTGIERQVRTTRISRFRIRAMVPYRLIQICDLGGAWHDNDGDCDLPMPRLPAQLRGRPAIVALRLREPSQFGDRTGVETQSPSLSCHAPPRSQ